MSYGSRKMSTRQSRLVGVVQFMVWLTMDHWRVAVPDNGSTLTRVGWTKSCVTKLVLATGYYVELHDIQSLAHCIHTASKAIDLTCTKP